MRYKLYPLCRIGGYLSGAICSFWFGYWLKNHFVIVEGMNNSVLLVLRESPYQSISMPVWIMNAIMGVLLCSTIVWVVPVFPTIRKVGGYRFTLFSVLLLVCTLPLYAHIDTGRFNYENLIRFSYYLVLSSVGIALCLRGLTDMQYTEKFHTILSRFLLSVSNLRYRIFLLTMFGSSVLVCCLLSWRVFDAVPGFSDSCVYMFQARLFAHGTLSSPLPPEPQFFEAIHVILSDKWYTQYPPGYPAILALGVLFRIPWFVNPFLGALTVVCIYLLANELYGENIAKLSAVLASISSFFLLMSSEFMSHTATLFFITLAFLSFVWMVKKKRPLLSAVVCGVSLGIALLCRPYTTAWICVPMGIAAIVTRKKLSLRYILIGAIPLLVACLTFLAYNYATTGHPLLLGYIALHGKEHYPGFHQDPWLDQFHTVAQGFKYVLGNLNALNYYLFEWPMPSLFFVCIFLVYGKKRFWEWLLVGWIAVLLIGHFFYFYNKLSFGPRFVYEALPALILLTSRGLSLSTQFIVSRWKVLSYPQARNILCLMLMGLFLFAFFLNMPTTAKSYQSYGKDVNIQKYLKKNDVAQALIFVQGVRARWVHYPFNAPFASPHIYAKDRGSENRRLAEKFPGYRYFIADEKEVVEVSIDEL